MEDMYFERRRAEACVDESAHHALVNAGEREIVLILCERRRGRRRRAREGACLGGATMPQPSMEEEEEEEDLFVFNDTVEGPRAPADIQV